MRYLLLIILFIACLVLGFQAGQEFTKTWSGSSDSPPEYSIAPTMAPLLTDQTNYLVIGVDRIGSLNAQLLSIWLVIEVPSENRYMFLPVFPLDERLKPGTNQEIPDAFSITKNGEISVSFWEILQNRELWWHHYFIVDEIAMMQLVDFIAGKTSGSILISGVDVIGKMPPWREYPMDTSNYQAQLVQMLCGTSSELSPDTSLMSMLELIPDHAYTDLVTHELLTLWERILASSDSITCEFPVHPALNR